MHSEWQGEHGSAMRDLSANLFPADAGNGHSGDAFLAADETETFVGGGFDADLVGLDAEGGGNVLFHRGGVWVDLWRFGDDGGIDVFDAHSFVSGDLSTFFEDLEATDAFDGRV